MIRGRWLDATLVLVGTLGPLLFSALLLAEAINERRFYARRGPPLSFLDPALMDDLGLLPAIAPEVQLLAALALAVHLGGAVAAFRGPAT